MDGKFISFLVPDASRVRVRTDGGKVFDSVPGSVAGKPALIVDLRDVPDGNGAWLDFFKDAYQLPSMHGIIRMRSINPVTGSVGFEFDHFEMVPSHPFGGESGFLEVRGTRLFREDGSPFSMRGASQFAIGERLLRGEDIVPVVDEGVAIGLNRNRMFAMYSPASFVGGGRGLRPQDFGDTYWQAMEYIRDLHVGRGIRWGVTLFPSVQTVMPALSEQRAFFDRWEDLLAPCPIADLELTNEQGLFDNSIDQHAFLGSRVRIWSRGCGGAGMPIVSDPNVGSVGQIHTGRTFDWPRKSAHNPMEDVEVHFGIPSWSDEPTGAGEHRIEWKRDNVPTRFRDAAAGAALLTGGSTFHSEAGKDSYLFPPVQRQCAEAFVAGAQAVDLRFRGGVYAPGHLHNCPIVHKDEWSSRTYARIVDGEACVVVIDRTPAWQLQLKDGWQVVTETQGVLYLAR